MVAQQKLKIIFWQQQVTYLVSWDEFRHFREWNVCSYNSKEDALICLNNEYLIC